MPPVSVLIKPASSKCNLQCEYCFYHDVARNRTVADYGFMSPDTIETIIRKVLQFTEGYATFSFQGGEPTVCGVQFFQSVVKLQKRYNENNAEVRNCIQTNGVLIDEEWAAFLHENRFLVGLSLDGPRDIHDTYRTGAGGRGTFKKVMQTAALFERHKVDYNILFVVTGSAARYPDRLYEFYKTNGQRFLQFMPCIDPEDATRGAHPYSLTPKRYAFFLKKFFDNWYQDIMGGRDISIRYFDNLVRMVMGMPPETCTMSGSCGCQFVFEADGSVYPCDFYVSDRWKLGNIHENGLLEMYENSRCREFIESSLVIAPECRDCKWKTLCRGGCRRDREDMQTGKPGRNYYCEAYYEFLEYAFPRLTEIARYVQKARSERRMAPTGTRT